MKLAELRLIAFGPFTDAVLRFETEAPGLHVVYGPNEAGKSTSLRALAGLFFGIPVRTVDGHLHTKKGTLRVGARLVDEEGKAVDLIRKKGNKNTLLGPGDEVVDEAVLRRLLGGLGADQFTSMFGLDHESLREGAAELLASGGDVGESLYGASLGTGIHEAITKLNEDAREIYTPQSRKAELSRAIKAHKDAVGLARGAGFSQVEYEGAAKALAAAARAREEHLARRGALRADQGKTARAMRVIPLLAKLAALTAERDALGEVPRLPASATADREATSRQLGEDHARLEQLQDDLTRAQAERDAIPEAGPLGDIRPETIETLRNRRGSVQKAQTDLPKREAARAQALRNAGRIIQAVSPGRAVEDARSLIPGTADRAAIEGLADSHGSLVSRVADAHRERSRAREELARLEETEEGQDDDDVIAALKGAVGTARALTDGELHLAEGGTEAEAQRRVADRLAAALRGFDGDAEAAAALAVPDGATVDRDSKRERDLDGAEGAAVGALVEARRELRRSEERLTADDLAGDVPSETLLDEQRGERQRLWQEIRQLLDEGRAAGDAETAPYEAAVDASDQTADRLRREASRVAQRAALEAHRETTLASVTEAVTEVEAAASAARAHRRGVVERWSALGVKTEGAAEMTGWLAQHREVCAAQAKVDEREAANAKLRARIEEVTDILRQALSEVGASTEGATTLRALGERAEALLTAAQSKKAERGARREQGEQARRAVADREFDVTERGAALEQWKEKWTAKVSALGLGGDAEPTEARALLGELTQLGRALDEAEDGAERIGSMQRDAEEFAGEVDALIDAHARDLRGQPLAERAGALIDRVLEAHKNLEGREKVEGRLGERRALIAKVEASIAQGERRLRELCAAGGANDLAELTAIEDRIIAARAKDEAIAEKETELAEAGGGRTVEALLTETAGLDLDRVQVHQGEIDQELADLDEVMTGTAQDIVRIQNEIAGHEEGMSAAEAAAAASAALAEVQDAAHRYVRLRLAWRLLLSEIEHYREANQAPILTKANELFPRLTLGRYEKLQVGTNAKDEPVLECVRAGGEEVGIDGLSDGTKDQLYLALRLASLLRFAEHNQPLPLILDDCLVHFDDDRARAALEVLGEVSETFQVLFFTHHARLVELAREVVPESRLGISFLGVEAPAAS